MKYKLENKFKVIDVYKGKSKFNFWNEMDYDDIIQISIRLQSQWGSPSIELHNKTKDTSFKTTLGTLENYLNKTELAPYNE